MRSFAFHTTSLLLMATVLAGSLSITAAADSAIPDPCELITLEEMEQIVGPLDGAPRATDPASGEITCDFTPKAGPSFIVITLHEGDLVSVRQSADYKDAVSLPEYGNDAFVNLNAYGYTDLYGKKGNLILQVSMPTGPEAVRMVKAIAAKAMVRL